MKCDNYELYLNKSVPYIQSLFHAERGGDRLSSGDECSAGQTVHQILNVHLNTQRHINTEAPQRISKTSNQIYGFEVL